ncbi:hypothetical protein ACCO45_004519 [Purpureocillium lilacinum]|uniref:Uncharacterized protein n=1 Tax=Purpureocillium lilacinum TaxID=33203 RepID=A0ACC4E5T3_PURLI
MKKVNPNGLNESTFVRSRTLPRQTTKRYLSGIEAGIKHLHSLGSVHNDINPSNIMISDDDAAVIIDFDSCVKIGGRAGAANIKRTPGWYKKNSSSLDDVNNDFAALQEL